MGQGSHVRMEVHGGPVGSQEITTNGEAAREARLARACRELETVLESADLAAEPEFADALVEAVSATNRVYELERDGDDTQADATADSAEPGTGAAAFADGESHAEDERLDSEDVSVPPARTIGESQH